MPANVPSYQEFLSSADMTRMQDPAVRDAFTKFFQRLDDWEERVALWINNNALSRLLATNVAVPGGSGSATITFANAQPDTSYLIVMDTSWGTTVPVSKTKTGFTVTFGTAAPGGGGTLSWALLR